MVRKLLGVLVLPPEISAFEREYLAKANRTTMWFFVLHVPAFVAVAWFNATSPLLALVLTALVALGPVIAYRRLENPRSVGLVYGFAAMLMGGLLVHFGQGPVQIEMHFYFFALLAMLALYGNPLAIVVAAVTVAVHHLILWLLLPSSVFNYAAPWWVVAVHAAFVVLESAATVYIARSFFDNVIGLEKVVQQRTAELDERNKAMRLVLDNVDQGLLTIDRMGRILPEYSAAISRWFGSPLSNQTLEAFFSRIDATFAAELALTWDQCLEGFLPVELTVSQAPSKLEHAGRHYRFGYRLLQDEQEQLTGMLLIVADVSADIERQRLEKEQQETLSVLDRIIVDRAGFMEFMHESEELIASLSSAPQGGEAIVKRALHTLKGNCMVFGVQTVAEQCHTIESDLASRPGLPSTAQTAELQATWSRLQYRLSALLGSQDRHRIEIEPAQLEELLRAAVEGRPTSEVVQLISDHKSERTAARLSRIAAQARRIAERLSKPGIDVQIDDAMLRLEPGRWGSFWAAFIHVVRNAVDHGLEPEDLRQQEGKPGRGRLVLRTFIDSSELVISVEDDGRGIDWKRVGERAAQAGLPHTSHDDLVAALFTDGISTTESITEYSGRGMGLSAVHAACRERGGSIEVHSKTGQGTSFMFKFPAHIMAVEPHALLGQSEVRPVRATSALAQSS